MIVPEQVVEKPTEHGTSAPSTSSIGGSGSASEVPPQTELTDAAAREKAVLVPSAAEARPALEPEVEPKEEEDIVEEV